MDTTQIYQAINAVSQKVNDINKRLNNMSNMFNNQRAADIDYIAMETGIDLDQDEKEEV